MQRIASRNFELYAKTERTGSVYRLDLDWSS
jgi:hypothetical protein